MSYLEWKAWEKKKLQKKKGKSNTKIIIESSDDSNIDYKKRCSSSSKMKKRADYHRVAHDYTFQIRSDHNASIHMGKPPHFDAYVLQHNYQALIILHSSVSAEVFDKIEDALTAKDAWDTLQVNHQRSRKVGESRIKTLEHELSLFSMKKDETVKEMYNRMKKITNQIMSLGRDKWGDREIVDKLLTVYMARDVTLPSLIRA
ncbi:uncharacterized protein C2845_PM14G09520 [Panicum miliaceum]|uniref:Uncharacterized protein n=1 Tax=Panicum miliaceum TaxID=4540 RepID=A0A3L6PRZ6_PANMI|nr:uncharacterized protein C2845_PM14G09520 [Panicum miliaceum]